MKTIKKSKRGLTFTLENLKIGQKYTYLIDKDKKQVRIIPKESGNMTVSRKKCGTSWKPLVDIRSKEIKELVGAADYIELEIMKNGDVLVTIRKKVGSKATRSNVIHIQEIIGRNVQQFVIPKQMLMVAGGYPTTLFGKPTLADETYFEYLTACASARIKPKKKEIRKVWDVISLFSGAGMFDKAFMDGRFRFVYGVDFDEAAVNTYRANIGDHIECKDIREVNANVLPKVDVVIGGPCCQAYSNSNRHNMDSEEAEAKRLLIDDYARIVKAKNPKVWVVENVPELLTKEQGFYFNRLCEELSDYEISAVVVADDEVGGYSIRRRAIVIGSKIGKIELPINAKITAKTIREALEKVDSTWFNYEDVTVPRAETVKKMSFVPQGGNWQDIPAPYNTYGPKTHSCIMRRLEWDKPSITLSNFRKSNILHPEENRILTVAEAAAIMGLEKDFRFIGDLADKQQMVANGVTQASGKFVKDSVLKALDATSNIKIMPTMA